jgi:type I restriction enzyme S subunit
MKKGWQKTARLGDLFMTAAGGTPLTTKREYYEGGTIPWLNSGEVRQGVVHSARTFITELGLRNSNAKIFPKDTVLVALYGATAAQVGILAIEAATNQAVFGIYPNSSFLPKFIFYFLLSCHQELSDQAVGSAQPNLSGLKVKDLQVPLAPLPEQQRIVGVLDEAFASLATAQAHAAQNLQNARELFESHLNAVFTHRGEGWVEKTLSDVCEISSSLVDPREKQFLDLPHVGGANIESKTGALIDIKTAREEGLISGKFAFDDTTVLYSKIRPYLMKVARPGFHGLCSADIYPMSPKAGQVDRDYLFHLMLSKHFTDYANIGSARAGMPKVNREHLFQYRTFLPSVAKQKELVTQLDALSAETQRLTRIYEQKLAALAALKKSLLHQAFNGEL